MSCRYKKGDDPILNQPFSITMKNQWASLSRVERQDVVNEIERLGVGETVTSSIHLYFVDNTIIKGEVRCAGLPANTRKENMEIIHHYINMLPNKWKHLFGKVVLLDEC